MYTFSNIHLSQRIWTLKIHHCPKKTECAQSLWRWMGALGQINIPEVVLWNTVLKNTENKRWWSKSLVSEELPLCGQSQDSTKMCTIFSSEITEHFILGIHQQNEIISSIQLCYQQTKYYLFEIKTNRTVK